VYLVDLLVILHPGETFLVAALQPTVNTLGTQRGRLPAVSVTITSSVVAALQTTVNTLGTQRGRLPAVPVIKISLVDADRFLESTVF
jgi:hypothetical protein